MIHWFSRKHQKYTGPMGTSHDPCWQMFVHISFPSFSWFNIMNIVDHILFSRFQIIQLIWETNWWVRCWRLMNNNLSRDCSEKPLVTNANSSSRMGALQPLFLGLASLWFLPSWKHISTTQLYYDLNQILLLSSGSTTIAYQLIELWWKGRVLPAFES